MNLTLMELRRYAIDNRAAIKFSDPQTGRQCLINDKGQLKIPGEDKNIRMEDAFAAAEGFEVVEAGKSLRLTREAMARAVADALKKRGVVTADHGED